MIAFKTMIITMALFLLPAWVSAQLLNKTALTLDAAKKIAAAVEADAKAKGARVVIAVVDDGGTLLWLERGATPLQGGTPIIVDGKIIRAIGVSGETPLEDEEIAQVGAEAEKRLR